MDVLKVKVNDEWVGIPSIKGDPGDPTELIDDTAGDGTTNKTWSANKIYDQLALNAKKGIVAANYSSSTSYAAGDYVIYNNDLYKCNGSTSGQWDSTKWDAVTVGAQLKTAFQNSSTVNTNVSQLATSIADAFSTSKTYEVGDLVTKSYHLYACTTAVTTAGAWDSSKWTRINVDDLLSAQNSALSAKYEKPSTGIPASDLASGVIPTVPVTDVQVNGTSVLSQGVANVPKASTDSFGAVKIDSSKGIYIINNDGILRTNPASASNCKGGGEPYRPIVPACQDAAAFYGLAKASGDNTQTSSSNAVGVYTEDAKSKIHDMLDAPVSVSGSTPSITAKAGVRYVCGECSTLTIVVPSSGIIDVTFESGSTATVLTVTPPTGQTVKWANGFDPTSLDANTTYELNIMDLMGVAGAWT